MSSHGRRCACGAGRGFKRWQLAAAVHNRMTSTPARYDRCHQGLWHWYPTEETAHA